MPKCPSDEFLGTVYSNGGRDVDWNLLLSPNFQPNIPNYKKEQRWKSDWRTCGTTVLSIITGKSPKCIEKHLPEQFKHWSNKLLKKYLENHNYYVIPIKRFSVTNTYWEYTPIGRQHVLLMNILMDNKTDGASYFLLYNGILYHNFYQMMNFNEYFFINKPIQSAFVVWHKKWA